MSTPLETTFQSLLCSGLLRASGRTGGLTYPADVAIAAAGGETAHGLVGAGAVDHKIRVVQSLPQARQQLEDVRVVVQDRVLLHVPAQYRRAKSEEKYK